MRKSPYIRELNGQLISAGLLALPLHEMKKVIAQNKRQEHEDFFEILKNRYCVKFIIEKIKMFYLLPFDDPLWQNHMVLLLFKKAKKYMLTSKIKVSYADMMSLKELILEPQQLAEYIERENNEFETIYSQFLREVGTLAREDPLASTEFLDNLDRPFDLDDSHFRKMTKRTVAKILTIEDENAAGVANSLLDICKIEDFLSKVVDFREKDRHFENFNNRLTNRELREMVKIKLTFLE